MGILLTTIKDKIAEGWVEKPKCIKQVAFEHGLLDVKNLYIYLKDGPKGDDNNSIGKLFSFRVK